MPLDPQTAVILDALTAAGADALGKGPPQQARAYERNTLAAARQVAEPGGPGYIDIPSVKDDTLAGPDGPLDVRIYRPNRPGLVPTVVYLHGGGFVLGGLETHDPHCRVICRDTESVVVSVAYRLAPEAPFPAAYEDSVAALRWAQENIDQLGGDPSRLVLAGDSAGGNLAAAVAANADVHLAAQLLIYPKTDFRAGVDYTSRTNNGEGYFLTLSMSDWFEEHYLQDDDRPDPRASVMTASVSAACPPAVIGVGEYDLLRDEVVAYATRLRAAGVDVRLHVFPGLVHGFFGMRLGSEAAAAAVSALTSDLRDLLWKG